MFSSTLQPRDVARAVTNGLYCVASLGAVSNVSTPKRTVPPLGQSTAGWPPAGAAVMPLGAAEAPPDADAGAGALAEAAADGLAAALAAIEAGALLGAALAGAGGTLPALATGDAGLAAPPHAASSITAAAAGARNRAAPCWRGNFVRMMEPDIDTLLRLIDPSW